MFCGHPSLRFGDVLHFIDLWGNSAMNTIVFTGTNLSKMSCSYVTFLVLICTEPSFPYLEALAPFQPLLMKAAYCPIDTKLNFTQAKKLIRELKPDKIALPKVYTQPPNSVPHRTDLTIEAVSRVEEENFRAFNSTRAFISDPWYFSVHSRALQERQGPHHEQLREHRHRSQLGQKPQLDRGQAGRLNCTNLWNATRSQ